MSEQQIRDALRDLAGRPGPPDERAAWDAIRGRVHRDGRRRRAGIGLVVGGVAAAGAAAAGLVVLTGGDDPEPLEVGPAATTTTSGERTTPAVVPAAPERQLPDHPIAVVVEVDGAQRLDLYDADTGAPFALGLAQSPHSISDVSIAPDGIVYFTEEFGDSSTVRAVAGDGSSAPVTPYGAEETETSAPALSPDGRRFAFLRHGITVAQPAVVVVDLDTGVRRTVEVGEPGSQLDGVEFAPDGDELFVVVDGDAWSVDATGTLPDGAGRRWYFDRGLVVDAHFSGGFELVLLVSCCPGDEVQRQSFSVVTEDGPGSVVLPPADGIRAFDVDRSESLALVGDDGTVRVALRLGAGEARPIPVEGRAVDVGF